MDIAEINIPGLTLTFQDYTQDIALFDFYLVAEEEKGELTFKIAYCSGLFKKETITAFARYFGEIISAVTINKEILINEIKISHQLLEPETSNIEDAMGDFGF